MQIKLKSGKMLDLSEEEMHEIKSMMMNKAFEKMDEYFHLMEEKAHSNLEMIAGDKIDSEKDLKESLAYLLRHGTYDEVADAIIESIEYMTSWHILNSTKEK